MKLFEFFVVVVENFITQITSNTYKLNDHNF